MSTRGLSEIANDWKTGCFASPGADNDRSALLDELVALEADLEACRLIGELEDEGERSVYSFLLAARLAMGDDATRARAAMVSLPNLDRRLRFAVLLDIYVATNDPSDLFRLRGNADHLAPPDRCWAYLMIYRQTKSCNDLFLAGQALKAPGREPGFRTVVAAQGGA